MSSSTTRCPSAIESPIAPPLKSETKRVDSHSDSWDKVETLEFFLKILT